MSIEESDNKVGEVVPPRTVAIDRIEPATDILKRIAQDAELFFAAERNLEIYKALPPGAERDRWLATHGGKSSQWSTFFLAVHETYIDVPEDICLTCILPEGLEVTDDYLRERCIREEPNPFERRRKIFDFSDGSEQVYTREFVLFGTCYNSPEPKSDPLDIVYIVDQLDNVVGITHPLYLPMEICSNEDVEIFVLDLKGKKVSQRHADELLSYFPEKSFMRVDAMGDNHLLVMFKD